MTLKLLKNTQIWFLLFFLGQVTFYTEARAAGAKKQPSSVPVISDKELMGGMQFDISQLRDFVKLGSGAGANAIAVTSEAPAALLDIKLLPIVDALYSWNLVSKKLPAIKKTRGGTPTRNYSLEIVGGLPTLVSLEKKRSYNLTATFFTEKPEDTWKRNNNKRTLRHGDVNKLESVEFILVPSAIEQWDTLFATLNKIGHKAKTSLRGSSASAAGSIEGTPKAPTFVLKDIHPTTWSLSQAQDKKRLIENLKLYQEYRKQKQFSLISHRFVHAYGLVLYPIQRGSAIGAGGIKTEVINASLTTLQGSPQTSASLGKTKTTIKKAIKEHNIAIVLEKMDGDLSDFVYKPPTQYQNQLLTNYYADIMHAHKIKNKKEAQAIVMTGTLPDGTDVPPIYKEILARSGQHYTKFGKGQWEDKSRAQFIISVASSVIEALQILHGKGNVHRDIKLENYFWKRGILEAGAATFAESHNPNDITPIVKMGDLGESIIIKTRVLPVSIEPLRKELRKPEPDKDFLTNQMMELVGTLSYLPPEMLAERKNSSKPLDLVKMDYWSTGVMIYKLVRGDITAHPLTEELDGDPALMNPQYLINLHDACSDPAGPRLIKQKIGDAINARKARGSGSSGVNAALDNIGMLLVNLLQCAPAKRSIYGM